MPFMKFSCNLALFYYIFIEELIFIIIVVFGMILILDIA